MFGQPAVQLVFEILGGAGVCVFGRGGAGGCLCVRVCVWGGGGAEGGDEGVGGGGVQARFLRGQGAFQGRVLGVYYTGVAPCRDALLCS